MSHFFFGEMCGGEVEDAKFLFIFVMVPAVGLALPATLAWWILWRGVGLEQKCCILFPLPACISGMVFVTLREKRYSLCGWKKTHSKKCIRK